MNDPNCLYAEDVAKLMNVGVSTARRYLARWEREHGADIVGRAGRTLFTTWPALERVTPLRRPAGTPAREDNSRLVRRLSAVERALADLERRCTDFGSRLCAVQKLAIIA